MFSKSQKLFIVLAGIFLTNIITAELIGSKLFSLEKSFGLNPLSLEIFGVSNLSLTLSTGVIAWPLIFTITDILNDYYGYKAVKFLSYLATVLLLLMFVLLLMAIHVAPSELWVLQNQQKGIGNMQFAYAQILGQSANIIVASVIAFLIGQLLDGFIFKQIKKITGNKHIWMRALISTLLSQFIDTVVVLYIAFYISQGYSLKIVLSWIVVAYLYKFCAAIIFLPVVYFFHYAVEKYLGKALAQQMRTASLHHSQNEFKHT